MAPRESTRGQVWLALAAGLLARALPLWLGVEHYGDAPVRIEAAERWLAAPHLWRGFGEAFQYGPLHLTLLAFAVQLFGRFVGPKLLSLAFGLLGIWLLHRIAARAAGRAAALLAALGLALSPLHIQASTSGASEAIFLALLLASLALVLEDRDRPATRRLLGSAVLLGLGCLVRYDGLLYIGLLAALYLSDALLTKAGPSVSSASRSPTAARALAFGAAASLLPALWFLQCWHADGQPFLALRHITRDHLGLVQGAVHYMGSLRYRLYCLGYWPAAVLILITPLVGLFALAGAARTLARLRWQRLADAQALALVAWLPAAYFTFRGAVLEDFRPLARFALVAATLSLPFAWDALTSLSQRLPAAGRTALVALTAVTLVATPAALAAASLHRDGALAEWARPFSPVSSLPPGLTQAARWLRANATPTDLVLLDHTWHYLDIGVAFESGLTEAQLARRAWPDFEAKLSKTAPTLAVLIIDGELKLTQGAEGATFGAGRFTFRGLPFCAAAHFVYASVYKRCPAP